MRYDIIFLRPREITRFRIQDGIFSEKTLKYIPADTIYSLYLSKLYEEGYIKNKDEKEIRNLEIPKITSAYPYLIKNGEIYFYLPFPYLSYGRNKKMKNLVRDPESFIEIEFLRKITESGGILEEEMVKWARNSYEIFPEIKIELITRNTLNRIENTTVEGCLFSEEYIFCCKSTNYEFGYFFIIEKGFKSFVEKIREFFEIRGIGADRSTTSSVFVLDSLKNIDAKNCKEKAKRLVGTVEKMRDMNIMFHPVILAQNIIERTDFSKIKLRYLVMDGKFIYLLASDGSKMPKEITSRKIVIPIERRFKGRLKFRIFYGL